MGAYHAANIYSGLTLGGLQVRFHDILFNYQNKYLQAGDTASLFKQGGKLSPFWALTARRYQD